MAGIYWREAASLILISKKTFEMVKKPLLPNYESLFLKRSGKSSFMPEIHVFPGGTVDNSDFDGRWIKYLCANGYSINHIKHNFECKAKRLEIYENKLNIAELGFRICALRETFEETGLLLINDSEKTNSSKVISDKNLAEEWMPKIQNDPRKFLKLFKHIGETPFILGLHEWSSWLTPTTFKGMKNRFNTVFYIVFIDSDFPLIDQSSHHSESEYIQKACPREMLMLYTKNKLNLAPPQIYELSRFLRIPDFVKLKEFSKSRAQLGTSNMFTVVFKATNGIISVLPGDSLYPTEVDIFSGNESPIEIDKTVEDARKMEKLNRLDLGNGRNYFAPFVNIDLEYGHISPVNHNFWNCDS